MQKSDTVKVKQETIRQHIGAAFLPTVNKAMHKLQELSLISMENNYNPVSGHYTRSSYRIIDFNPQKDYFLLPTEYSAVDMPPMAYQLMLTLYMLSFNDSYSFPSYTEITKITGMSSASISKSIGILEEKGIIKKENYIKKDGSKGHNRYFIIKKIQRIIQSDKAVKLLQWIRSQKQICFEVWQIIKEVIRGNALILNEICAISNDNQNSSNDSLNKDFENESQIYSNEDNISSVPENLIACCYSGKEYTNQRSDPEKNTPFDYFGKKVSKFRKKFKEIFGFAIQNLKKVLFKNYNIIS